MAKNRVLIAAAVVAALVFVLALPVAAQCGGDDCRLTPPQSRQVNPGASSGSGSTAYFGYPGLAQPVAIGDDALVTVADIIVSRPPSTVDLTVDGQASTVGIPKALYFDKLDLRLRYQDPSEVSCGVQALGMAFDGLEGAAPTSAALLAFLQNNGMIYSFGTGAEELAYAAHYFGYEGSYAFQDWGLDELLAELAAGRPVVVSLGANGEGLPGHFVTVTGLSPDGQWVAYNDPILGEQVVPSEEFLGLWGLQGNAGVAVMGEPPASAPDHGPWVAFAVGLMALISATPLALRRKGIGGGLLAGAGAMSPPYAAPPGHRWEQRQTPVHVWREVEVVEKVEVPNMVTRPVQVGTRTVYEELPVYKTVTVDEGYWDTEPVTRYRSDRYVKGYTTRSKRILEPDCRWLTLPVRVPIYGTRSVPYADTERRWVSRPVKKQIRVGTKKIPVQVPIYEEQEVQEGTRIVEGTRTKRKRIRVGTEPTWTLVPTPPPPPTPAPIDTPEPPSLEPVASSTPEPEVTPERTPVAQRAPYPPGFVAVEDEWPDAAEIEGKWLGRITRLFKKGKDALTAAAIQYTALDNGRYSVSAPSRAIGTRREFLSGYGYDGTVYNPSTISRINAGRLIRGTFSRSTLGFGFATSLGANLYDYGVRKNWDRGIFSQEFAVSTAVDFGLTLATGVAAAAVVAVVALGLSVVSSATIPAAAILAATAGVAFVIGVGLDYFNVGHGLKDAVNENLDTWHGQQIENQRDWANRENEIRPPTPQSSEIQPTGTPSPPAISTPMPEVLR